MIDSSVGQQVIAFSSQHLQKQVHLVLCSADNVPKAMKMRNFQTVNVCLMPAVNSIVNQSCKNGQYLYIIKPILNFFSLLEKRLQK